MFKKSALTLAILFILNSCAVSQKSSSMNDWYAFTKTSTERQQPSEAYEFSDGMIRMYGDNNGYLMSKKSYNNFELSLEYKWNTKEKFKTKTKKTAASCTTYPPIILIKSGQKESSFK